MEKCGFGKVINISDGSRGVICGEKIVIGNKEFIPEQLSKNTFGEPIYFFYSAEESMTIRPTSDGNGVITFYKGRIRPTGDGNGVSKYMGDLECSSTEILLIEKCKNYVFC